MPRRSTKVDVRDALAMLRMADVEWGRNGLIPYESNGPAVDYRAMRFLDAYRGQFPSSLPRAVEQVDEFVGNLVFSIVNTLMGQLSARDPEVVIRPHGGTAAGSDAWRRAWLNQKVVQTLIREKNYRREVDRALQSAIILPFGLVRHGYTPDFEEYEDERGNIIARMKNQTPDLPWVQALRPWQVRIDPLVNNFDMNGEPGWIAFQNLYRSEYEIDQNPKLLGSKDWRATYCHDPRPFHERNTQRPAHSGVPTAGASRGKKDSGIDLWEEWVIYDIRKRTFYGVSHGAERLVREETDWPIDWGQLPASILTLNEQLDSPFGISFVEMIWHEQMLYNKVLTIIKALVNRFRRIIFVNKNAFQTSLAQQENLLDADSLQEFILSDGNVNDVAKEVGFGQLDGQLVGLLFQLKEQMREVLGVSSFQRGQRANVETAAEANQIGAGGEIARSRVQAKVENFWVDVFRAAHRALLQTEDARNFFLPIVGEDNLMFLTEGEIAQGFVEVGMKDLQGEFDYGVKLNSTTPLDPMAEFTKVAQAYSIVGGPQSATTDHIHVQKRIWTLAGEDSEKTTISREVANQMGAEGGGGESDPSNQPPQEMSPNAVMGGPA